MDIFCSKCELPLKETDTTDDLDGNLRTHFTCACGTSIYVISATIEDDDENGIIEVDTPSIPGRIIAHFVPQQWVNGYAMTLDEGHKYFDVTEAVLAMGKEQALALRDDQKETDNIIPDNLRGDHSGPFYIEVADQIRQYFDYLHDLHDEG